jgi:hypothetical protein
MNLHWSRFKQRRIPSHVRLFALLFLATGLLSAFALPARAGVGDIGGSASVANEVGTSSPATGIMGAPRTLTTAQIMAIQAQRDAASPAVGVPAQLKPHFVNRSKKSDGSTSAVSAPAQAVQLSAADAKVSGPKTPQTVGTTFLGTQLSESGFIPPDAMGAVGPTQVMVTSNGRFKVFSKTGVLGPLNVTSDSFFSILSPVGTSDPRVRFDRLANRWIVIMIDIGFPNKFLFAVSDTATITSASAWTFNAITEQRDPDGAGAQTCLADYPTLGVDAYNYYVGTNDFCGTSLGTAVLTYTTGYMFPKSVILFGGTYYYYGLMSGGVGIFTPQGADNLYVTAPTAAYFVGVDNASFSTLRVNRYGNLTGVPTSSGNMSVSVATTDYCPNGISVPTLGGTFLDALDDRLYNAYIRFGVLWAAHNIGTNASGGFTSVDRCSMRWYALNNLTSTPPTIYQSGTNFFSGAGGTSMWIPSVATAGQGHTAFSMSYSSTTILGGAITCGRLASDALNFNCAGAAYVAAGVGTGYDLSGAPERWGDYSYVSVDPCDDMSMWVANEYVNATNSWGVRMGRLLAPPPAAISSVSPSTIPRGKNNIWLLVSGTSSSGSGYFDPSFASSCGINTTVSGLIKNADSYFSPTFTFVNVSTVGASLGAKTLTVTNPDGQSVSLGSAVNVVAGQVETIGVWRVIGGVGTFLLRNSNTTGSADITTFGGGTGFYPVTGDWDGDGVETRGVYNQSTGQFQLWNDNGSGAIDYTPVLGNPGDVPISGDWTGSGRDGIGTFRPTNGLIYLRNDPTTSGFADFTMVLGIPGDKPLAGDWNNNGIDSPGVYRPSASPQFFLTDQVCNCAVTADYSPVFGISGDVPVAGDWNGDGITGIGVYRPSTGFTMLRNDPTTSGFADISFVYGNPGDVPLGGHWVAGSPVLVADPKSGAPNQGPLAPTFVPKKP